MSVDFNCEYKYPCSDGNVYCCKNFEKSEPCPGEKNCKWFINVVHSSATISQHYIDLANPKGDIASFDVIGRPSHYTSGRKYEPKDVIRDWKLNFNLGNVVKYVSRAGRKDDILQDLKKARQYLDFEIEAIEAEREQ